MFHMILLVYKGSEYVFGSTDTAWKRETLTTRGNVAPSECLVAILANKVQTSKVISFT